MTRKSRRKWTSLLLSCLLAATFTAPVMACEMDMSADMPATMQLAQDKGPCHEPREDQPPASETPCKQCLTGCLAPQATAIKQSFGVEFATINATFLQIQPSAEIPGHPRAVFRPPNTVPTT